MRLWMEMENQDKSKRHSLHFLYLMDKPSYLDWNKHLLVLNEWGKFKTKRIWALLTLFIDNLLRVGSLEYWLLGRYTAESGLSEKNETGERFKDSNQIFLQYMLMLNSAKLVQSYNCFRDIQPTPIPSVSGLWGRMCWRSSASWWAIEIVFCICAKWA